MPSASAPVFDTARELHIEFPAITVIPADKATARAELAAAMVATSVKITVCPPQPPGIDADDDVTSRPKAANDNRKPQMAVNGQWIGDEFFPDTPQHWLDKEEVAAKKEQQAETIRKARARIVKRQAIGDGWDGRAGNDNAEPLPLITALSRDGRNDEISLIRRYRLLADVVGGSAYGDTVLAGTGDGVEIETRTGFPDQERLVAAAKDKDWKSLPAGDIIHHETRQTTKQKLSTGSRSKPANDNTAGAAAPLSLGRGEDAIIARLDAAPIFQKLQAALGPLLAVFEDAALEGATFTAIGEARGYNGKQASAAGRALIYAAVDALANAWAEIDGQRKTAARAAHDAVQQQRAQIAERQIAFLRRVS